MKFETIIDDPLLYTAFMLVCGLCSFVLGMLLGFIWLLAR